MLHRWNGKETNKGKGVNNSFNSWIDKTDSVNERMRV